MRWRQQVESDGQHRLGKLRSTIISLLPKRLMTRLNSAGDFITPSQDDVMSPCNNERQSSETRPRDPLGPVWTVFLGSNLSENAIPL